MHQLFVSDLNVFKQVIQKLIISVVFDSSFVSVHFLRLLFFL